MDKPWETEIDDIVFCIDNNKKVMYHETINPISLTIDKAYKVTDTSNYAIYDSTANYQIGFYYTITIVDDNGEKASYRAERFLTLQEWRQKQLQRLLDGTQV